MLVLAPPAKPVVLLGEVRELEVQGERAQHLALALERERCNRPGEPGPGGGRAGRAGAARELADPLLVGEQILAALFDEHAAEDPAE